MMPSKRVILILLLFLYGMLYIASLVLLQNATVHHTYTAGASSLISDRYVTLYWFALFLGASRILVVMSGYSLLLYQHILCGSERRVPVCRIFWSTILVGLVVLDLLSFAILSNDYTQCNKVGQLGNPCNDMAYCCVPEIYSDSQHLCPNTQNCTGIEVDFQHLRPDDSFIWLFCTYVLFNALNVIILYLSPVFYSGDSALGSSYFECFNLGLMDDEDQPIGDDDDDYYEENAAAAAATIKPLLRDRISMKQSPQVLVGLRNARVSSLRPRK